MRPADVVELTAAKIPDTSLTSLPSNGVPGMGTRAFTGKDSGCSGMLGCSSVSGIPFTAM